MDENLNVQELDYQDTIPENLSEETNDIGDGDENIVTPNNDFQAFDNIARDTEINNLQRSVSERTETKEPFVSVQYNHKNRDFTREEAIQFIQKGMHTESLRTKLEYLAKQQNTDINSLVEKIVSAPENTYRKHLEELYGRGSPDVEIGMAIYREKRSEEYKKIMADSERSVEEQRKIEGVNSRLADQYIMLKKEMPDAPEYSNIPDSVIREAAEGKRDLYSAYLHYLYKEKTKIDAALKTKNAANNASTGKMDVGNGDTVSTAERSFLSGLWEK